MKFNHLFMRIGLIKMKLLTLLLICITLIAALGRENDGEETFQASLLRRRAQAASAVATANSGLIGPNINNWYGWRERCGIPPLTFQFCGGIGGFPCPTGFACVDDPRDDCSPLTGGADCTGICIPRVRAGGLNGGILL